MKNAEAEGRDSRPLKEILDEIEYEARPLNYGGYSVIQDDLRTILERYGETDDKDS